MLTSSPDAPLATAADHAACRAAICTGSKSFFAASMLLPPSVRIPSFGLYAFCRLSDDAVDEAGSRRCRKAAAESLSQRLTLAYAGRPANTAADRALADIVARHAIPEALPRALLEGLAWDARDRRYGTLSELTDYAARVAGAVGAMMTLIMGVRDPAVLARACDLGVAMQFTNIARDVGEDARAGRLYLPLDWLAEAGIDPDAFLAAPVASPALRAVVARLLDTAEVLYRRSESGIVGLPVACRPAIRAARLIYAEIGRAIAANGLDSVSQRARVSGSRKAVLLARAALPKLALTPSEASALTETAYLIEGVRHHPLPTAALVRRLPPWWDVSGRIVHVLDLIEQWEERDLFQRSAPINILPRHSRVA
ncbi:phytoene/squalene synthase family protein [Methylobacterium brachythecii]|uniref:Phytoene synthase n=1 Tax=Methylobacterium brachythecii TaxID=1176177 RepID=A0A7W6AKD5_9HYPH|nr:phytoene/squalene synthase family protein [Methylobacterium brachythecii]MBB3905037.1 phytoene synthase [Methylobacterium brachythecii]GLS46307.1 phytoene synthase [Methylobacterium brachythecii]